MPNIFQRIGGLFRREQPPVPPPVPQPEPEREERRGIFARLRDRVTGADRRREEAERQERERQAEQQRQEREVARAREIEARERAIVERELQVQERERQVRDRERHVQEQERQVQKPEPQVQKPERTISPAPAPELPKFAYGDMFDYIERDERAFGVDSELVRSLEDAVADFIADRGGLDGLNMIAREWLESPTISEAFSDYWQSGGFTADQVLGGMSSISNIQIVEGEDGDIHVEFDYDAEVDGYEVSGHAS